MVSKNRNASNIDLIAGKKVTNVLYSNQRTDFYDKMTSYFSEVKAKHQSLEPGEYMGLLLYTINRKVSELLEFYPEQSKFFTQIMKEHGKSEYTENSTIYECIVHVPELSGVLPWPNSDAIIEAFSDPEEAAISVSDFEERKKSYPKKVAKAYPEILKLAMYPKFYYFNPDYGAPAFGNMCIVQFSDSISTKGLGIYVKTLSETWVDKVD